jgi:hypothetical protein
MASVNLAPVINGTSVLGTTGLPLAGGLIYTYQAGSSTALATYTDNGGTIANSNPIVLNADGRAPNEIWLQAGYSYKFQIETALGVVVQTLDNLYGIPQTSGGGGGSPIPTGCILIWSGSSGSIPSGFQLCDGTNGTPDLRNNFVLGAGNSYVVGQTGGSADAIIVSHTHTVIDAGHTHTTTSSVGSAGSGAGLRVADVVSTETPSRTTVNTATTGITIQTAGTSGSGANMPPYYALCYIYKT